MTRTHATFVLLATLGMAASPLVGQGKPPMSTSSYKHGSDVNVTVSYEARSWEERDARRKWGTIQTKKPILLGGQPIDKGTHTLEIDASDPGRLRVVPRSRKAEPVEWEFETSETESPRLWMSFRGGAGDAVALEVGFGKLRRTLALASLTGAEAALKKDPAIRAIDAMLDKANVSKNDADWRTKMPKPGPVEFDPKRKYFWNLDTSEGRIVIRFMPDIAPMHVTSTTSLTRAGFYDGLTFHRVISKFMAQGGCSNGSGSGSCGYVYDGEFSDDVIHDRAGLLSMANAGPGTDGSQFFITFAPAPNLDGKHTIFGEVVEGMKTVERLEDAGSEDGGPKKKLVIERATVSIR